MGNEKTKSTTALQGKRALVTGSARRLGREFALALAREGCDIVVHHHQSDGPAENVRSELLSLGVRAAVVKADLQRHDEVLRLACEASGAFGGLDILVNNASVYATSDRAVSNHSLGEETLEEWERSLAVNARAPFFLIQSLAPVLKNGREPSIVNILDKSVTLPYRSRAAHSVSKSALLAVTRLASVTLHPSIRVNALEFGGILKGDDMDSDEAGVIKWGTVQDAISALLFVLKTQFVSGEVIGVKGNTLSSDG